ncbi:YtpI family protein [Paenibacillus gansuensis]|uniref:YtpI family protein n=1 Tax=Paenibacillus gansuensis TaxID=306542 RepID=A0ABW5PG30_9BACL
MVQAVYYFFLLLIIISAVFSVFNSFKSRRQTDPSLKGLYAARTNISMGALLIVISIMQLFLFQGSSLRVIIGVLFLLMGVFNLFAGIRNHSYFSKMQR